MKTRIIPTAFAALAGVGLVSSLAACGGQVASAEVGACVDSEAMGSDEITDIPTVDCTEEHDSQVVGKFDLDDGDFPGQDAIRTAASEQCTTAFADFVGIAYEESSLDITFVGPSQETWDQADDREVICFAVTADGSTVTESWEGAAM